MSGVTLVARPHREAFVLVGVRRSSFSVRRSPFFVLRSHS